MRACARSLSLGKRNVGNRWRIDHVCNFERIWTAIYQWRLDRGRVMLGILDKRRSDNQWSSGA
jgi:hypothetical protein